MAFAGGLALRTAAGVDNDNDWITFVNRLSIKGAELPSVALSIAEAILQTRIAVLDASTLTLESIPPDWHVRETRDASDLQPWRPNHPNHHYILLVNYDGHYDVAMPNTTPLTPPVAAFATHPWFVDFITSKVLPDPPNADIRTVFTTHEQLRGPPLTLVDLTPATWEVC